MDETASAASLILAANHELEAWGDADLGSGMMGLAQPLLRPLWDTRSAEDALMQIASIAVGEIEFGATDYATYVQNRWRELFRATSGLGRFEVSLCRWRRSHT